MPPRRTTSSHPIFVQNRGWVEAANLRAGDMVRGIDGQWTKVDGVEDSGREETVYNFIVEEYHTYFVGGLCWGFSVWAHNGEAEDDCWKRIKDKREKARQDAERDMEAEDAFLNERDREMHLGKGPNDLERHHSIPKQIQNHKELPPEVRNHPDVRGRAGNPNIPG